MSRRAKIGCAFGLVMITLFLARNAIAQAMVAFEAPHHVHAPTGTMTPMLSAKVDTDAKASAAASIDAFIHFALTETATQFHFGLSHKTKLRYDGVEREANCVEYADLFATIVNRESSDAHAYVVRSDARILGERSASPAWKDHDWVLIVTKTDRFYVDPTLYDMGLGWNIASSVRGKVTTP
ncbi:MAG: hypothetical protein ABI551_21035 [Polyangiaceae bacterium]